MKKKSLYILLISMILILMTGCQKEVAFTYLDNGILSQATADEGEAVGEALKKAGVELAENDKTEPALDTLVSDGATISLLRYAHVTVEAENWVKDAEVYNGTVEDVLNAADITLSEGQYIREGMDMPVSDGMTLHFVQMKKVKITVDGGKQSIWTEAKTVGDALKEAGIKVGKKDRVSPSVKKKIKKDVTKVVINRVKMKTVTETEAIPYGYESEYTSNMNKGDSKVTREGSDGKKELIYEVTYVDGKEESRELIEENVLEEPVSQITLYGTYVKPSRTVVSREDLPDCDDSGHGMTIITYSDGTEEVIHY